MNEHHTGFQRRLHSMVHPDCPYEQAPFLGDWYRDHSSWKVCRWHFFSVRRRWTKRQSFGGGKRTGTRRVLFALRLLRIINRFCWVEYVIQFIYLFSYYGLSCPCLSLSYDNCLATMFNTDRCGCKQPSEKTLENVHRRQVR